MYLIIYQNVSLKTNSFLYLVIKMVIFMRETFLKEKSQASEFSGLRTETNIKGSFFMIISMDRVPCIISMAIRFQIY